MLLKATAGKKIPIFLPCSTTTTCANKTGTWRFFRPVYREKTAPCAAACPAGEDLPRIEMLLARGAHRDAWQTLLRENPFPAVCGRVCFHPCEKVCNRSGLDDPVAVCQLERALGDLAIDEGWMPPAPSLSKDKKAAVIGAGPAGLAAAYFLSLLGYGCDVFESRPAPGGLLRWGIPTYRLPTDVLEAEIDRIRQMGVRINCNAGMRDSDLTGLQQRYDAVVITCGHGRPVALNVKGAAHAVDGLSLLNRIRSGSPSPQKGPVAVIGGGNTALDAARSLVRLGASPVIVYRRRREDMPAHAPEIARALEEGVELMELAAPVSIDRESAGGETFYALKLQKMKPAADQFAGRRRVVPLEGRTLVLRANKVVAAIGGEAEADWTGVSSNRGDRLRLTHCMLTRGQTPIVAGGDLTAPAKTVPDAIASGKQAAMALDLFFERGMDKIAPYMDACRVGPGPALSLGAYCEAAAGQPWARTEMVVGFERINPDYFEPARRHSAAWLSPRQRSASFSECRGTLSARAAASEARRCFNCGICNGCDNCRLYCPEGVVTVDKAERNIDLDYCKGCGVCVAECPRDAMAMEE